MSILDTDCDPTNVDFPVPGNDDAMRSVQVLLTELVNSICEAKANGRKVSVYADGSTISRAYLL